VTASALDIPAALWFAWIRSKYGAKILYHTSIAEFDFLERSGEGWRHEWAGRGWIVPKKLNNKRDNLL